MAEKNKLLELIGDDKELKATLDEMVAASRAAGVAVGKAEGLAIGLKKVKAEKTKGKPESLEPKKPDCFKTYKKSFENHPAKCRGCFFAMACKVK